MRGLLDNENLNGVHEARVNVRLARDAAAIRPDEELFLAQVEQLCSLWGGAVTPIVPKDESGAISPLYAAKLPGAAVDGVSGLHPFELFDLSNAAIQAATDRESLFEQLALPLLKYRKQDSYAPMEVVSLDASDPWRLIYAACLGLAPREFDPTALRQANLISTVRMKDFVHINRVAAEGSIGDLLDRMTGRDRNTPRTLSMVHLPYGGSGSSSIRSDTKVLPEPWFPAYDAGPNIVVVCSPGSVDDAMLLWNLRGSHGDSRPVPIGVPLSEATASTIAAISSHPLLARNGFSAQRLYVTSASLTAGALSERLGKSKSFSVESPESLLSFGTFGWSRDEVLVWANGRSHFVPLPVNHQPKVLRNRALNSNLYFRVDVSIQDAPFPSGDDIRVDSLDGDLYSGSKTTWGMSRILTEAREISWPSRLLTARAVAARRNIDLAESEPGRAARVMIERLEDLTYVRNLAHAPLLKLLEGMAARHGFGWYKQRLRGVGGVPDPIDSVGPTVDELPERSFGELKKAFGNSDKATRNWLTWAEASGLVVKGFPLQCELCLAKQWIPVDAFSPPVICRGCAREISMPFGNRHTIEFKFRLAERLRRIYEHDAMGHLLTACFFDSVMSNRLVGLHPGMEVQRTGSTQVLGEADVLLLTRQAELVPIEVKRTSTGITQAELEKLDVLSIALKSPWSAVVACQYAAEMTDELQMHELRGTDGTYRRIPLSYDRLLSPRAFWAVADDPFAWNPLDEAAIEGRQHEFVKRFEQWDSNAGQRWSDETMLRNPAEGLNERQQG
ncbi:hypothetical protein [Microbacterium aurum]